MITDDTMLQFETDLAKLGDRSRDFCHPVGIRKSKPTLARVRVRINVGPNGAAL